MAVRNLSYLLSLLSLRGEIIFTLDQVKANPLTQSYVPVYEGLRGDWGWFVPSWQSQTMSR